MSEICIPQERQEKNKQRTKWRPRGYLYIAPLGLLLIAFYFVPIVMSVGLSFTKYNIMAPPEFAGLANYKKLFGDKTLIRALGNTLLFMVGVVPVQTMGALIMANWLNAWKTRKTARFVQIVMFIPVISSMVLISIVWRILLNGDMSPLNIAVGYLGLRQDWLGNTDMALFTLMGIFVWKNIGYFMVLFIAALIDIPDTYYDAAKVDGAGAIQRFWHITLPQLKNTIVLVVFLGTIWSFQVFDLVYTLTGGGPGNATMTMVMHIYNLNFKQFNTGYAMAVANILFFVNATLTIMQRKLLKADH